MSGRNFTIPDQPHRMMEEQALFTHPPQEKRSFLTWWYRLSMPPRDSKTSAHDITDRSQLASIFLLIALIVTIAFIPSALTSDDMHVVPSVIAMLVLTSIGIWQNRQGRVTVAGILIVVAVDLALIYSLLSYPGMILTQNAVPIYDMFVLSDLIAVSLLPGKSILYISFYHSLFMCADIALQPHTPDLQRLLNETGYTIMIRPLTIQIVVGLVTYLWVRNTMKALERANKAELIAQLERTIAEQKKEMDVGIQQVLQTLVRAANGDLRARTPVARENVLWQVDLAVNTLISRLQRSQQSEIELQRLKKDLQRLILTLREAKHKQNLLFLMPGGTALDPVITELLGCYVIQNPTGPERKK